MQQNETIFFDGDQCSFNTVEGPLGGGGRDKEAQRNFKIAFIDFKPVRINLKVLLKTP